MKELWCNGVYIHGLSQSLWSLVKKLVQGGDMWAAKGGKQGWLVGGLINNLVYVQVLVRFVYTLGVIGYRVN